jgi:hypothetical protein
MALPIVRESTQAHAEQAEQAEQTEQTEKK